MAKAYDSARTRSYIPTCDRELPPAEQTVFTLGWLSVFDFSAIEEDFSKSGDQGGTFPKLIEIVRHSLRGWTNFKLPDGTDAAFVKGPDGFPTKETMTLVGPREVIELARDCDSQERLTPDEVGKS